MPLVVGISIFIRSWEKEGPRDWIIVLFLIAELIFRAQRFHFDGSLYVTYRFRIFTLCRPYPAVHYLVWIWYYDLMTLVMSGRGEAVLYITTSDELSRQGNRERKRLQRIKSNFRTLSSF